MESKTKSVIIDPAATKKVSNTANTKVTEKIYVDANKIQTNNAHSQEKTSKNTNQYFSYFPDFYKREFKRAEINAITLTVFSLAMIVFFILACTFTIKIGNPSSYWLIAIYVLPILIFFPIYFKVLYTLKRFVIESKTINFKDQKTLSINIVKVYKSMKVANINANWFCGLVYVLCVLTFLLLVIVAWGFGFYTDAAGNTIKWDGSWTSFRNIFTQAFNSSSSPLSIILLPQNGAVGYFISFVTLIITFFLAIFMHISTVTSSYVRIGRIEGYYNSFIVAPAEIGELKKKTNRRDMIIFCICSIIVGLIVYSIYKSIKGKKNK